MKPKINIEELPKKTDSFQVPEDYWGKMQTEVLQKVQQEAIQPQGKSIQWTKWLSISGVAAAIVFAFVWFMTQKPATQVAQIDTESRLEKIITPKAELASILDDDGLIELTDEELMEIAEETHPENEKNAIINFLHDADIEEEEILENI